MALIVKDRVQETSSTTGTGTLTLSGAVSGFQTFSSTIGNGNTTYYTITDGVNWEVGIGTVAAGTLSRDTVLSNSLGTTALITFAAGVKNVFVTYPAGKSVTKSADLTSGRVTYATTDGVLADSANLVFDGSDLGLGVTPSAWTAASWNAFQLGSGASIAGRVVAGTEDQVYVSTNAYNDGAWKYIATGNAANYYQDNGEHVWRTAASGTAGAAITFTQAMTLSATGNLGIGITPIANTRIASYDTNATVYTSTGATALPVGSTIAIGNLSNTNGGYVGITFGANQAAGTSSATYMGNFSNSGSLTGTMVFGRRTGSATYAESMRLDSSGNVGIGVTPSAWGLDGVLEFSVPGSALVAYSANNTNIYSNAYYNGTADTYVATNTATKYQQTAGGHRWYTAPSGTAGTAITFTQAMTLDADGDLGIGTATPTAKLDVTGSFGASIEGVFTNTNTGASASAGVRGVGNSTGYWMLRQYGTGVTATAFGQTLANYSALFSDGASSNGLLVGSLTADPVIFGTNNAERMRIHSSGGVSIGNTTDPGATNLSVTGTVSARTSGTNTTASFYAATTGGSFASMYSRSGDPFTSFVSQTGSAYAPTVGMTYTHNSTFSGIYSLGVLNQSAANSGACVLHHIDSTGANGRTWQFEGSTGNFTSSGSVAGTNITPGGNVTGSSASCTGNAATATTATNVSGGTVNSTTLNVAGNGSSADPYGTAAVTEPANANNYSYYGSTRAGQIGLGFGITGTTGALGLGANSYWLGQSGAGSAGVMTVGWVAFNGSSFNTSGAIAATTTVTGTTINASQPFIVNSLTATVSYSIPAGSSASSAGPITVNSGVTITVPSGSRWVVL